MTQLLAAFHNTTYISIYVYLLFLFPSLALLTFVVTENVSILFTENIYFCSADVWTKTLGLKPRVSYEGYTIGLCVLMIVLLLVLCSRQFYTILVNAQVYVLMFINEFVRNSVAFESNILFFLNFVSKPSFFF